jgi:Uma2 family endonuclease
MEAKKFKTSDDLEYAWINDERVELIYGEIIKRPMARFEHGCVQREISGELHFLGRKGGSGGWWFATEVSVRYNEHNVPCHDIAGWRKERVAKRPSGVVEIIPDWVCEIVSPGHEKKDTLTIFNLLLNFQVPYYWIIWPEDQSIIAYKLVNGTYNVIASIENAGKARIEPFEEVEFDLDEIFGVE